LLGSTGKLVPSRHFGTPARRVPILKDETKSALLEKAKKYEQQLYGKRPTPDPQPKLFG
jgi:hypothetical protein